MEPFVLDCMGRRVVVKRCAMREDSEEMCYEREQLDLMIANSNSHVQ